MRAAASVSISRTTPSPPVVFTLAARAVANSILAHAQRIGILERFGGSVQAVSHVRVHRAQPGECRPRAHAAGDGFIVRKLAAPAVRAESMPPIVRLFIVPWLAAGILCGSAWANALNRTSTMRCEVSTFPPATDAGWTALTTVPAGATTFNRRHQSGAGRHVALKQTTKDVGDCRNRDRFHGVDGAGALAAALPVKSTSACCP